MIRILLAYPISLKAIPHLCQKQPSCPVDDMAAFSATEGLALMESGDYSELTITCGDVTFKLHKSIVFDSLRISEGCKSF